VTARLPLFGAQRMEAVRWKLRSWKLGAWGAAIGSATRIHEKATAHRDFGQRRRRRRCSHWNSLKIQQCVWVVCPKSRLKAMAQQHPRTAREKTKNTTKKKIKTLSMEWEQFEKFTKLVHKLARIGGERGAG